MVKGGTGAVAHTSEVSQSFNQFFFSFSIIIFLFSIFCMCIPAAYTSKVRPSFNKVFFSFSKLLDVVLGPVSVEELVSIEDAPTARFARYGIKINILTCR